MAFDYGSIDLGIKNPFKLEGKIKALSGSIQTFFGLYLLIDAASYIKDDTYAGWILVFFGMYILGRGLKFLGQGIFSTLRFFVGRNHPTSLSRNYRESQEEVSKKEYPDILYDKDKDLEEMLIGRKNIKFLEPSGFLARLLYSIFPKLLFMPYPIRNMAQYVFSAWVKTAIGLLSYLLVAFVTKMGFVGTVGDDIFPVYSTILIVYLIMVWRKAGNPIERDAEKNVYSLGHSDLKWVLAISLILPVALGVLFSKILSSANTSISQFEAFISSLPQIHTNIYLAVILMLAILSSIPIIIMMSKRLNYTKPTTDVSELRDNWQESVHPNEIFINLENLVMANRRYKEVPNRVYRELKPDLKQEVKDKGKFRGELMQEVQPKVKSMELGAAFNKMRLLTLIGGNVLFVSAMAIIVVLAFKTIDMVTIARSINLSSLNSINDNNHQEYIDSIMLVINLSFVSFILTTFGRLLTNVARLFFAEIQFESLLIYFKCEGTFTESKISTGAGIHDSTRSENTLVRSSITPWIIVTRIITTTFADSGFKNLEHPRMILEMHKSDDDLMGIKDDVIAFLKDRESIANITSARDLNNAAQLYQLNQQTRAIPDKQQIEQDEEAAGYLRQEAEINAEKEQTSET